MAAGVRVRERRGAVKIMGLKTWRGVVLCTRPCMRRSLWVDKDFVTPASKRRRTGHNKQQEEGEEEDNLQRVRRGEPESQRAAGRWRRWRRENTFKNKTGGAAVCSLEKSKQTNKNNKQHTQKSCL